MPHDAARAPVKVALDTTFAGVNATGVGLYSTRLACALAAQATHLRLDLRCYGPGCGDYARRHTLRSLAQEWPVTTHILLPMRLLRNKPNITHSTSHIGPVWGPGKRVVTVHDLIFRRYPHDYDPIWLLITRLTLPAVLRRAAAIIADSHTTKRDVERFYGVHPARIVVVYPGVDKVQPLARDSGAGPAAGRERYVLCLGPWVRRKNLDVVVRAFGQIAHRIPDLRLVITGEPVAGMQGYTPAQLIGTLPGDIRSRVQLTGFVDRAELPSLLANASALAYPSRWEGFGLPPLEAMSAGVPVLASDTPAVAEATGGAACLCDPDDAQQWARALERVLLDHEHAQRMIEAGRRQSATFTWEQCAAQTAQVYHRIAYSARAGDNGGRA